MKRWDFKIAALSDFGTPLRGDTLFGQICWALRYRKGEVALETALDGYLNGHPFLIISDGLPSGWIPKPELPAPSTNDIRETDFSRRKMWAKRKWLSRSVLGHPLVDAYGSLESMGEPQVFSEALQPHNTVNRITGTTGTGAFAPYQSERLVSPKGTELEFDLVTLVDTARVSVEELALWLSDVGQTGYGRDASIGLGKFKVVEAREVANPPQDVASSYVTLAPCFPPPAGLKEGASFWRPFTRFGRHGGGAVAGPVFKRPIMLADTGAALAPVQKPAGGWLGVGIGGSGQLSAAISGAVHQGYAPVLPIDLRGWDV